MLSVTIPSKQNPPS